LKPIAKPEAQLCFFQAPHIPFVVRSENTSRTSRSALQIHEHSPVCCRELLVWTCMGNTIRSLRHQGPPGLPGGEPRALSLIARLLSHRLVQAQMRKVVAFSRFRAEYFVFRSSRKPRPISRRRLNTATQLFFFHFSWATTNCSKHTPGTHVAAQPSVPAGTPTP
jgi:hypothetical protein